MPKYPYFCAFPTLHYTFENLPCIYDTIFQTLSPVELIRISQTCKAGLKAIRCYRRRAFSINKLLSRFFKDPCAFRSLQARTGTLISGSQALQFFARRRWSQSDLDIYTWPKYAMDVGLWIKNEGYTFTPNSYQPANFVAAATPKELQDLDTEREPFTALDVQHDQQYAITGIRNVFTFVKQTDAEPLTLQIIVARQSPIYVLLNFHSTNVMNFISWNKAYSLYPFATLEKSRSLICFVPSSPCPRYDNAMIKYTKRGFTMVADMYSHEDQRCVFNERPRFVGDNHSWIMSLAIDGIQVPTLHLELSPDFDPYLVNGWSLEKYCIADSQFQINRACIRMDIFLIRCSILRHIYTAPRAFLDYVLPFISGQGRLEHSKLSVAETALYAGPHQPKPSFWHFCDEEFVDIARQWIPIPKVAKRSTDPRHIPPMHTISLDPYV